MPKTFIRLLDNGKNDLFRKNEFLENFSILPPPARWIPTTGISIGKPTKIDSCRSLAAMTGKMNQETWQGTVYAKGLNSFPLTSSIDPSPMGLTKRHTYNFEIKDLRNFDDK